jgi:hypothetical protein
MEKVTIDLCDEQELEAFAEICRDNHRLKRVIKQDRWGNVTVEKKPMKRPKPAHVARAEREARERICYGKDV